MEGVDLEAVLAVQKETNSTVAMVRKLDVPGRQEKLKNRMQKMEEVGDFRPPVSGMGERLVEKATTSFRGQPVRLQQRTLQSTRDYDSSTTTMEI